MFKREGGSYPIQKIEQDWVLDQEALGSKRKFWYRDPGDRAPWLFKYPQLATGQHWAEKIAAEVAGALGIFHAIVELAELAGSRGPQRSLSLGKGESFTTAIKFSQGGFWVTIPFGNSANPTTRLTIFCCRLRDHL
jgi:hypothetical protein